MGLGLRRARVGVGRAGVRVRVWAAVRGGFLGVGVGWSGGLAGVSGLAGGRGLAGGGG